MGMDASGLDVCTKMAFSTSQDALPMYAYHVDFVVVIDALHGRTFCGISMRELTASYLAHREHVLTFRSVRYGRVGRIYN